MKPDIKPEGWSFAECITEVECLSEVDIWKGNHKVLAKYLVEHKESNDRLQVELFNEVLKLQEVVAECKRRMLKVSRSPFFNSPDALLPADAWAVQTQARMALDAIKRAGL